MRQAGILAAAGLIALEQGRRSWQQDHANAKFLAEGLAQIPGIKIDPAKVQTNILICDITRHRHDLGRVVAETCASANVLANGVGPQAHPLRHASRRVARAVCQGVGEA